MMHNPMKGPVEISKVGVVHDFISPFLRCRRYLDPRSVISEI